MSLKLGVVMDPIAQINIKKDSTFAMLLAAQARGWDLWYMEQRDLHLVDGVTHARPRRITVNDDPHGWYESGPITPMALHDLDVVLMRKDPPFDMEYVYTTYLLERAEERGLRVVNKPASLRDCNEKLYTAWFPQCCPPTLVTRTGDLLRAFLGQHRDIILKPLGAMGGASVFRVDADDPNVGVIIETLTDHGQRFAMAQRFIPEISAGDKRILLVGGEPVPYALARVPATGETRGNLAAGATGVGVPLTERDHWICSEIAPHLRAKGLVFVGIDVIGDYLTEINVTSPTCIRELDRLYGLDIADTLMGHIENDLRP